MNSPSTVTAPPPVSRLSKIIRRGLWSLTVIVSLITLYWQWENWRSARELAAVHSRVIERLGTDDPRVLAPPSIPDEQNYFANPVFERWLTPPSDASNAAVYVFPETGLLPDDFIAPTQDVTDGLTGEPAGLDLDLWVKQRAEAGRPLPGGQSPAETLARELGDGNGLLPQLAVGLNRPFSEIKPGWRESLEASARNPLWVPFPNCRHLLAFQDQMGLHLMSAARVGDREKAAETAQIMLRLGESTSRAGLVGCLLSMGLYSQIFNALHDVLGHDVWTEATLGVLQLRLAQVDDLEMLEQAQKTELLQVFQQGLYYRDHPRELVNGIGGEHRDNQPWWERIAEKALEQLMVHGPVGLHDANIAYYVDCMLGSVGPSRPDAWLQAGEREGVAKARTEITWPNPRRLFGAIAIPQLGAISSDAAEVLFRRRCLIIACALEKHRLRHGSFPASLEVLDHDLAPFNVSDPARPEMRIEYRPEADGYLLWSAGQDATDEGGHPITDWLWRLRFKTRS